MATTTNQPVLPDVELVETDGEPLDSAWHRDEINLLVEVIRYRFRDRRDYFVGGNMFIYFNVEQARNRDFRGPDFFFVDEVQRYDQLRPYWVVWEEGGKYPNVIIELVSASTADEDRTTKKRIYERTFRTPEYFLYDPDTRRLDGWRLSCERYKPIEPNEHGWLWSEQLELWLGIWEGQYQGAQGAWLRFYDAEGQLVPLFAEAERQRAEAERQRAETVEAELARLRAIIAKQNGPTDGADGTSQK